MWKLSFNRISLAIQMSLVTSFIYIYLLRMPECWCKRNVEVWWLCRNACWPQCIEFYGFRERVRKLVQRMADACQLVRWRIQGANGGHNTLKRWKFNWWIISRITLDFEEINFEISWVCFLYNLCLHYVWIVHTISATEQFHCNKTSCRRIWTIAKTLLAPESPIEGHFARYDSTAEGY